MSVKKVNPQVAVGKGKYRGTRYPWDKWFRRNHFTLTRGVEYTCQSHGMAIGVRTAAFKRGYKVSLKHGEGYIQVTVKDRKAYQPSKEVRRAT